MLRWLIILISIAFISPYLFAQNVDFLNLDQEVSGSDDEIPNSVDEIVTWEFSVTYEGDEAVLQMIAYQKEHWHIYSQVQPEGGIPFIATKFKFEPSDYYQLIGNVREFGAEESPDPEYPEKAFYGDEAKFEQRIKITSRQDFEIKLEYAFTVCKLVCFPEEIREFMFKVKGIDNLRTGTTEKIDIADETGTGNTAETTLDTTFNFLSAACDGFNYVEVFDPVKVSVSQPWRTDNKTYSLSLTISIDSIFAMYAFDNPEGYKSAIKLHENENIASKGDYSTTIKKIIDNKSKRYKYEVELRQNITVKDTHNLTPVTGELDLYLAGCDNDFHNTENVQFSFDIANASDNGTRTENDSLWMIFFLSFIGGFLALMTPCVFPMIPMTMAFFTKQSKTRVQGIRKAFMYAGFIIVIYLILGVLVSQIAGPDALNAMATDPIVNIIFFLLFIAFAISFFGAFEISLPTSWVNKADKKADKGGITGIFFMALTLALVSFSCTGPIVGSVLVQSAAGGIAGPMVAMLGFSIALALPFGLFAAFPGWMNSLPQSGGWLNSVKVSLGFLEIALALKFLSNADLVMQWHLLERELFIAIWIAVFMMLFIYLIGKIQFPHDSHSEKLSVGRGVFALIVLGFTIYLIPGIWGAPLKLISGFTPPMTYSEAQYGIHGEAPEVEEGWPASTHAHGHGINVIYDYQEALAYAKKENKPLLIDFTGWACVNCRKMEEYVWADPNVASIMANDYVIASLYVDDRGDVPAKYQGDLNVNGKPLKNIGEKWKKMEIEKYDEITQPMYVIVDHGENNIAGKANYQTHGNAESFKAWLEKGKSQFKDSKNAKVKIPEFTLVSVDGEALGSDIELR